MATICISRWNVFKQTNLLRWLRAGDYIDCRNSQNNLKGYPILVDDCVQFAFSHNALSMIDLIVNGHINGVLNKGNFFFLPGVFLCLPLLHHHPLHCRTSSSSPPSLLLLPHQPESGGMPAPDVVTLSTGTVYWTSLDDSARLLLWIKGMMSSPHPSLLHDRKGRWRSKGRYALGDLNQL